MFLCCFCRYDIYSSMVYNVTDIKYEMACILYNIGSLHTELGAMDARNTPDGMKISCTHFQCAAWAFQVMHDNATQCPVVLVWGRIVESSWYVTRFTVELKRRHYSFIRKFYIAYINDWCFCVTFYSIYETRIHNHESQT